MQTNQTHDSYLQQLESALQVAKAALITNDESTKAAALTDVNNALDQIQCNKAPILSG